MIGISARYRLNENWGVHIAERYEAQNGSFQEQDYTIYRDMRSWTAALNFAVMQGPAQPTDFTVAITFSLKAFPRFPLNSDTDRPRGLSSTSSVLDY